MCDSECSLKCICTIHAVLIINFGPYMEIVISFRAKNVLASLYGMILTQTFYLQYINYANEEIH